MKRPESTVHPAERVMLWLALSWLAAVLIEHAAALICGG